MGLAGLAPRFVDLVGIVLVVLVAGLAGCKNSFKYDRAVMKAPPKRTTLDDSATEEAAALAEAKRSRGEIRQTSAESGEKSVDDSDELFNAKVVARVNGYPILAGEVLERHSVVLQEMREKMPPEEYQGWRDNALKNYLPYYIERKLLTERFKADLKAEQLKQIEDQLDKYFDQDQSNGLPHWKKQFGATTRAEVERELRKRGTSLAEMKQAWANQTIAMEYIKSKLEKPVKPDRPDLIEYYQSHREDFTRPARIKWQQIQVSHDGTARGELKARSKLSEAREAIQGGMSFDEAARRFSDGPTAREGGKWDWSRQGSLADRELENQLYSAPIGKLSPVIERPGALHLVRVMDRENSGLIPFEDVQAEITERIEKERAPTPKKLLEELRRTATIETEYDLGPRPTL